MILRIIYANNYADMSLLIFQAWLYTRDGSSQIDISQWRARSGLNYALQIPSYFWYIISIAFYLTLLHVSYFLERHLHLKILTGSTYLVLPSVHFFISALFHYDHAPHIYINWSIFNVQRFFQQGSLQKFLETLVLWIIRWDKRYRLSLALKDLLVCSYQCRKTIAISLTQCWKSSWYGQEWCWWWMFCTVCTFLGARKMFCLNKKV